MMKRVILSALAVLTLAAAIPAEAQYHHPHRHRVCYYRHHHRVCSWR